MGAHGIGRLDGEAPSAAAADVIVSGDRHLVALKEWQGIRVLSPADLIETLS